MLSFLLVLVIFLGSLNIRVDIFHPFWKFLSVQHSAFHSFSAITAGPGLQLRWAIKASTLSLVLTSDHISGLSGSHIPSSDMPNPTPCWNLLPLLIFFYL
jgi:hypothetical protein